MTVGGVSLRLGRLAEFVPMRLNPPSIAIFVISLIIAAVALISKFGAIGINVPRYLPHQEYWLAMTAYFVLMVGVMARGL
jgi:hypothetical protein